MFSLKSLKMQEDFELKNDYFVDTLHMSIELKNI